MDVPELLAPAGSLDALYAAVAAGADAVYVGLGAFNARAANAGLSLAELARGCALAHAHGTRVYVTLNVCLRDAELPEAIEMARAAVAAGADALIVADAGLCLRLRTELPHSELHLSTQTGVQCAEAVALAAAELGVARVTCARELSVSELRTLCATGVPVEAFCHGAICICYSGACSYSALMRGRSANRGDCAQPCRMAYELQDASGTVLAGGAWDRAGRGVAAAQADGTVGDRLLCPRDYLGIRQVEELVRTGVASLKIEGRMKSPDYVFNVVRCYRAALDAVACEHPLDVDALDELEAQLARSFNRGFTDGYLRGSHAATGAEHMSFERAINQGLFVGRIADCRHEEVVVALTRAVDAGDMLEIRSTPGADAAPDVPKRWPIVPCPASAQEGERLVVHCKRKVEAGSAVHVVRSARVLAETEAAVAAMREEAERLQTPAPAEGDTPTAGQLVEAGHISGGRFVRRSRTTPEGCMSGPLSIPVLGTCDLGEVCRAVDVPRVRAALTAGCPLICRNLGQVALACAAGVPWEAAAPINVWNAETARWLQSLGAQRIWLPEELSAADVGAIRAAASPTLARIIDTPASGYTPLMVTEHCLLTAEGPCDHACATCPRRLASQRGDRFLVELDRTSGHARLRVRVDELGRTRIFV